MPPTARPEPDQKHAVQRQFGAVAANYGRASFVHRQGPDLDALVASLEGTRARRALDVGCGAGHTAHALASLIPDVVALDLTEAMLEQTRRGATELGLDHLETRLGDAETLPFEDGSFDVVACRLCAHHFGDPAQAVREAFRVLAPGGQYLLIDIVAPEDPTCDTFLQAFEVVRDPSHVRDHSVTQWQAMLAQAGFVAPRVRTWPMPQQFGAWAERIGATPTAKAALVEMFGAAPNEVRSHFAIEGTPVETFSIENALFEARRPA